MNHALDPTPPPTRFVPRSPFGPHGLEPERELWFNIGLGALLVIFAAAWSYAVYQAFATGATPPMLTRAATVSPLSREAPPPAAYLFDAAMRAMVGEQLRGASGAVRVVVRKPGEGITPPQALPPGAKIQYGAEGKAPAAAPPSTPGVWNVLVSMRDAVQQVPNLNLLTLVPLSEKKGGKIGTYTIGTWPYERGGRPRSAAYTPPAGLVRVVPDNLNLQVSDHFQLRDFVTKGQVSTWPKYVAMSPRLLDKLELTIQQLQKSGTPVTNVGVISGFRTPTYNETGGSTAGRAGLSRHMYGDAMDIYIDNNNDGRMDDLNHDGRIDKNDGRVIVKAAEAVERTNPELVGGVGLYSPRPGAHSGFVHIDTRGYRARWGM